MTDYFRIVSHHGTLLGVHEASGAVACVPEMRTPAGTLPLVAFRLEARPGLIFLVAGSERPFAINIGAGSFSNAVIVAGATVVPSGEDFWTLHDPLSGRYLAAPPVQGPSQVATVTASRDRADLWEYFRFIPVDAIDIGQSGRSVAGTVRTLFGGPLDAESIVRFILAHDDDVGADAALNSALAFLSRDQIVELADQIMTRPELLATLGSLFAADLWATVGLRDLARWQRDRTAAVRPAPADPEPAQRAARLARLMKGLAWDAGSARSRTEALAEPISPERPAAGARRRIHIGPDLDPLSSGLDGGHFIAGGRFASLPHACNIMARRKALPRRKACIVMSARNEGIYLLEWIAYHRAVGFDDFFIYSNNNDDGSDALLAALAEAGIITWIDNEMSPGVRSQYKAYGHAFGVLPEVLDFEWSLVVDADEFFVVNPDRFGSVAEYLSWQERREVDAIALNWRFLASNNEVSCLDASLTRRDTRFVGNPLIGDGFRLIKTMFRPRLITRARAHTPVCDERSSFTYRLSTGDLHLYQAAPPGFHADPGFSDKVNTDNACIYHYYYKSAEEWLWKNSRNRGDGPMQTGFPPRMFTDEWIKDFMRQNDEPNQEVDRRMPHFAGRLDEQIAALQALPGVSDATRNVQNAYRARLEALKQAVRVSPVCENLGDLTLRFLSLAQVL